MTYAKDTSLYSNDSFFVFYYNKRLAFLKSKLKDNKHTSKQIRSLTNKRNNKIKDYLHKASRILVNHVVSNGINTIIIGHNKC